MLIKYRIISYDDYINPTLKKEDTMEYDNEILFPDLIKDLIISYNPSYISKQYILIIYVKILGKNTFPLNL